MAMAVVQNTDDEQKSTQMQENPTLGGGQSSTLGQSAGIPQQQSAGTEKRGSGMGTRLSNLRKYVESNRGSGMAGKIESGIKDIRTGVETGIGQSQTKLQEQAGAEKSRLTAGEQLVKSSQEGGKGLFEQGKTQQFTQDITPKVEQEVPSFQDYGKTAEERLGTFEKYKAGQAEQLAIENEQKLKSDLENLQKRADLSQSEAGRYQLLRETFQRPGYTTGQQRLDQLILQAAPEQAQQLKQMTQNIATPAQQKLQELQALKEAEQKAITGQATGLSSNIKKQLFGESGQPVIDPATGQVTEVGGVLGQFQSDLANKVTQAREVAGTQYGQLGAIIRGGYDVNPELLAKLGVSDVAKAQEFIDYYKRGQGQTLQEKTKKGLAYDTKDLDMISKVLGTDPNTISSILNQTPVPIDQTNYNQEQYNSYVKSIADNKTSLRNQIQQGLDINENLKQFRATGPELDYSKYLRELSPEAIGASNVASQEDYARQAALKSLAGLEFGPLSSTGLNEAGTYGDVGVGRFDINQALSEAREKYNLPTYDQYGRVTVPESGTYTDKAIVSTQHLVDKIGTDAFDDTINKSYAPVQLSESGIVKLTQGDIKGSVVDLTKAAYHASAAPISLPVSAVKSVVKAFCFVAGSKVLMSNLEYLNIEDIMPGEEIFGGGNIDIVGKALSNDIYNYNGIEVSGSHPTFEDGKWIRIKDSKVAKKLDKYTDNVIVYTMCTENHLMVVGDYIFTDFIEYDGSSLVSQEEAINVLNNDTKFVERVQKDLNEQLYYQKI